MREILEAKLRTHKAAVEKLKSRYCEELAKGYRARHNPTLMFLWKESSMHEFVINELEDILLQA